MSSRESFISERIWRCSCGGSHYLAVSGMQDEDGYTCWLGFDWLERADSFIDRIKACWDILRGIDNCTHDIVLNLDTAREICAELTKVADEYEKSPYR